MDLAGDERPGTTVIVVTGGDPPMGVGESLPFVTRVIAADSGAYTALALGLVVDEAVGDFDSVSPAGLKALAEQGASVEAHERDKDATDLELALSAALRHQPARVLVLGGLGGRVDHELANLLLLGVDALAGVDVVLQSGRRTVTVVRPGRLVTITGNAGDLVSLMPLNGAAVGVTTSGLRWLLMDAELPPGTTRGVSNELLGQQASLTCTGGVLLVVQPGWVASFVPPRSQIPPSTREVPDDR
jgi:thiamine pyrophosphokinase